MLVGFVNQDNSLNVPRIKLFTGLALGSLEQANRAINECISGRMENSLDSNYQVIACTYVKTGFTLFNIIG